MYSIFLIALGVAQSNGVNVPAWAWVITIVLACLTLIAMVAKVLREDK